MVAAGVAVDPGRPPEFTHCDHQRFLKHAAAREIIDQGCERMVGRRDQVVLEPAENILVRVPVGSLSVILAIINGDESNAGLDQTPGQQNALPQLIPAIAVASFGSSKLRLNACRTAGECNRRNAFSV